MLVRSRREIIDESRLLSHQALDPDSYYQHSTIGYNYRLSNILAAIGRAQLRVLADRVRRRREIHSRYQQLLAVPGLTFMPEAHYGRSSRWLTVILIDPIKFGADREMVR